MARAKRKIVGLVAGLVVAAGWGCGGGGAPPVSSSQEEADVKGVVTVKGQPATKGEVTFDPSNINRKDAKLYTTKIGPDGSYATKTLVGDNLIRVQTPKAEYELNVVVNSGENTFPIDVP